MRSIIGFCFVVVLLFGCRNANKKEAVVLHPNKIFVKAKVADTTIAQNKENRLNDTLIQVYGGDDTIRFSRERLNMAYKLIPQFRDNFISSPDIAYAARGMGYVPNNKEEKEFMLFGCEVCQDDYFLMYTYFLKQRNSGKQAEKDRKQLIAIYRLINSLHGSIQQGGTYFGHQYSRLYAYAEYSVQLRSNYDESDSKDYPVASQKYVFISALKQLILDDEKYNLQVARSDKPNRKLTMMNKLNALNKLITNHFYLAQAQEFNYSNYRQNPI